MNEEQAAMPEALLPFSDWIEKNPNDGKEPLAKYRGYSDYVKQETLAQGRYSDTFVDKLDTKLAGLAVESGDYPLAEGQTEYVPAEVLARPKSDDIPIDSLLRKAYSPDTPEDDPLRGAVSKYEALRRLRDEGHSTPEAFAAAEADLRQLATPEVLNAATRKDVKDGFSLAMVVPPATEGGAPDVFVNKSLLEFVNPEDRSIDTAALGKALKMKGTDPSLIPAILAKLTTPAGYGKTAMEMEMHGDDMSTLDTLARTADADQNYKLYEELGKIANSRERGNSYAAEFGEFRLKQLTKGTPLEGKDLMTLADDFNRMREMPEIDEANPAAALRTLSTGEVIAPMNLMLNDTAFATALKSVPLAQQPYIQKQREYAVESSASDIIRTISDNSQGGDEFVAYMDSQRAAGKKDSQIVKDWVGMGKFSATSTTLEGVVSSLGEAVMPYVALATGVDPDGFAMKAMQGAQIEDANRRAYADLFGKPLGMGYDLSRLAAPIAADLGAAYLTRGASMATTAGVRATAGVAVKSLMRSALTAETRSLTGAWVRASAMSGIKSAGLKVTGRETVDEVVSMAGRDIVNKIATGTAYTTSMATGFNRSALSTYASLSTALSNQTNPDGTAKYSPEEVKEIAMPHSLAAGTITAAVVGGFSAFGAPGLEAMLKRGGVSNPQFTRIIGRLRKDVGKLPQGVDTSSANAMLTDIVRKAVTPIWKNAGLTGGLQEGAEEGIESFLQTFNESMATGERVDILAAAKQAFYESALGGVAGGTITGVGAAITDSKAPPARVEADIRRERLLEMAGKLEATSPQTAQVFRNYAFAQRTMIPARQNLEADLKAAKTPEAKLAIQTKIDTLNEQSTRSRTQELAPAQENLPEADATAAGNVPQGGDEGMAPEGAPVAEGSPEGSAATGTGVVEPATRETVETEFAELVEDSPPDTSSVTQRGGQSETSARPPASFQIEQPPAQTAPTAPEVSKAPLTDAPKVLTQTTGRGDARSSKRQVTQEGIDRVDAAKQRLRDIVNNKDIVGKQRADAIANGNKLISFLDARADTRKPLKTIYFKGDLAAFDGEDAPDGFQSIIMLEGANAGDSRVVSDDYAKSYTTATDESLKKSPSPTIPATAPTTDGTLPGLTMPPRKRSMSSMRDATVNKLDAIDRRLARESDEDNYGVLEAGKQRLTELLGKIENVMLAEANAARQELTARPLSASPEAIVEVAEAENVTMAEVVKTPDTDANYLAAVETGDIETAQRLVDEAAKTLGLTEVFHGTRADTPILPEDFRTQGGAKLGAGAYFTPDKFTADGYDARNNASRYFIDADLPGYAEYDAGLTTEQIAQGVTVPLEGYGRNAAWAVNSGGVEIVVRDNRYIYSAEPVIRDAKGKPIPLSERFKRRGNAGQLTPAVTTAPTPAPLSPRAMQTLLSAKRIGDFSGPSNADARAAIMSEIAGKKVPKAKAGVSVFVDAVANHFGVSREGKTLNAYETDVTAAIRKAAAREERKSKDYGIKLSTPMMDQYLAMRRSLPDDVLLAYRLGDFYEFFGDDATVSAPLMGVTLTKRGGVPMTGIPYHSAQQYINNLLKAGKRVAIAEQTSEAIPGKLVEREIARIFKPETTPTPTETSVISDILTEVPEGYPVTREQAQVLAAVTVHPGGVANALAASPEAREAAAALLAAKGVATEGMNAIDLAIIGEGELKADPTIAALAGRPAAKDVKTEVVSWAEAQLASLRGAEPEKPETLEFTNSAGTTYRIVKTRKNLETFIKKAKAMQTGTPKYVKPRGKNFPQVDIVKTDKQYFGRTDKRAVPDKDLRKDDSIITGLQDPEYRAKLVKRLGESEIAALEDVILAKYETTREELLGETRAQPATAQNSVQSELDKFGISDGITAFLTNVSKRGGKQYGSLAQLLLDAGAGSVDTRLVNLPNTDAAGFYVGANGVVHINTARNGPRGAVDTVLHELLHAVTEGSLKNPTPEQAKVIAKISRVRATVIKRAKAQGVYTSDLEYALGSNSEFLTHFFTSQRFRDQVSSMTPKSEKNWVQVIADLIADLVHGRLRTKAERMSDSLRKDLVTLIQSPTKGLNSGDMIRNLYAGEGANMPQFKRDSLETARAMAAAGKSSEEIRALTGWFPGKYDGKMRWEIPDSGAELNSFGLPTRVANSSVGSYEFPSLGTPSMVLSDTDPLVVWLKKNPQEGVSIQNYALNQVTVYVPRIDLTTTRLGAVLDHPRLYRAYPDLFAVKVNHVDGGNGASYFSSTDTIELNLTNANAKSLLLHEIQHAIQKREGFPKGGNLEVAARNITTSGDAYKQAKAEAEVAESEYQRIKQQKIEERRKQLGVPEVLEAELADIDPVVMAARSAASKARVNADYLVKNVEAYKVSSEDRYAGYRNIAGEIEARDVQARANLTPEQLAATAPYSSENIAPEDAIVLFQPATARDVARFNQLTESLYQGRSEATAAEIETWREANPDAWAELSRMRETVLREMGYDVETFRGQEDSQTTLGSYVDDPDTRTVFSTTSRKAAELYNNNVKRFFVKNPRPFTENANFRPKGEVFNVEDIKYYVENGNHTGAVIYDVIDIPDDIEESMSTREAVDAGYAGDLHILFNPEQIKSADPLTSGQKITPDQWADAASPDIRFQPSTVPSDAEYLAAVEAGDMDTAQRMVNSGEVEMTRGIFDALNVRPELTQRATTIHKRLTEQGVIQPEDFENGKGLVYGDGKGVASEFLGAESYEPYPPTGFQPDYAGDRSAGRGDVIGKKYETILNTFVLNVVDPQTRDFIVRDIANLLQKGGRAVLVTRGTDVLNSKPIQDFGNMSRLQKSGSGMTYQKGFTQPELVAYLQNTLGEEFTVQPLKGGSSGDVRAQFVKNTDRSLSNPLAVDSSVRLQPSNKRDAAYLALAKDPEKNRKALQRLVDEAARAAGYGVKAYHGGANVTEFNVFPMFLSPYENVARSYAENRAAGGMKAKLHSVFIKAENPADGDQVINAAKIQGVEGMIGEDSPPHEFLSPGMVGKEEAERVALQLQEDGFDSAHTDGDFSMDFDFVEYDSWTIFNPSQIKSADPVTYDDKGNVIPLSRRFNATSPDIRFKPLTESDFAPASLRDTATGFLPDDVTLDDLAIDFADLADIVEGLTPVNAENVVHAKVNHALARRAGEAAIPAPVRDGFDSDEAFDAATTEHAAEVARLTDTYELITRGRLTSEAMFRYRINPGALQRLVDYLTAAIKAAYNRFTARYDTGTAVALNRMSRDLARARKGFNHDIEPMAVYDADAVLLLPVENTDTARFNELTKDLDPQDIEGWKANHPEELKELTAMRERVLRAAGYDTLTYHGTPESGFTEFRPRDGQQGIFFSDKQSVADSYTMKRGMWLSQGKNPKVVSALLRFRNPLVIDALGNRWDNIPFPGVQWKPKSFGNIPSGAINVNEAVRRAFEMGHDAVIIRDVLDSVDQQSRVKSTVYAVRNPTQIKSADPLALNASGRIITPNQWGDTGNPSIQFQPAVNEQGFYSQLERVVEAKIPNRATPEQIMGTISNPSSGVKAEEIKWSGIEQALGNLAVDGKVSRDALMKYLADEGAVRFEEVTLGKTLPSQQAIWQRIRDAGYDVQEDGYGEVMDRETGEDVAFRDLPVSVQRDVQALSADEGNGNDVTKFGQYVLPGGENYHEVVLAMPTTKPDKLDMMTREQMVAWYQDQVGYDIEEDDGSMTDTELRKFIREYIAEAGGENIGTPIVGEYRSSHFPDVPNYVAHMRTNERDGGLFIEEIQSDRHQAGRKKGYREDRDPEVIAAARTNLDDLQGQLQERAQELRSENGFPTELRAVMAMGQEAKTRHDAIRDADARYTTLRDQVAAARQRLAMLETDGDIPDAPFRTTWPLALFKRALRDAVASGKTWIGWTVGETQNDRFDLSKQVDSVSIGKFGSGWQVIGRKGGEVLIDTTVDSDVKLAETIGKDLAEKAIQRGGGTFEGNDLKVGGTGMKGFYDNMLPKEIGKYVKQWGGKVEQTELVTGETKVDDSEWKRRNYPGVPWDVEMRAEYERHQKPIVEKAPIWRIDITPAMRESVQQQGQVLFQPAAPQSTARQEQQLLNAEAPMQRVATLFKRDPGTKAGADITPSENAVIRRLTEFFVNPFGALSRSNTKSKQNRDAMMETIEYTVSSLSKRLDAARTKEEANPTAVQLAVGNIDPLLTPAMQEQIKEDFVNEVSDAEQEIEATYEEEAATNPIEAAENRAVALAEAHKIAERNRQKAIWSARSAEADSRREQQLQALAQLEREAPDTYEAIIDLRGTVNRLQRLVKEANPDSPEIHAIVDQSFGVYLVRSYGIHQDPKQIDLMMNSQEPLYKERREALTAFFKEKAFDEIMSELDKDPQFFKQYGQSFDYDKAFADMQRIAEAESGERAKMMFEDYMLSRQSARGTFGEGSTVTNEIQRYMAKSNMPQEFLDALMVNEDPVFNIANTAMSLGRLVFNSRMLNEIYDSGIESGRLITEAEFKTGITYADGKEEMRRVFATGENDEVKLEILDVLVKHLNAKAQEAYDNGRSDTPPDKDALYVQAATAMQDFASTPNSQLSDILPQLGRRADRTATDTFISSVNLSRESKAKLQARPGRFAGWQPLVTTNVGNSAFKPLGGLYAEPEQVKAFNATFRINSNGIGHFADDFVAKAHRFVIAGAGASLLVATQGSPAYFVRNVVGNTFVGLMNGVTPFRPENVTLAGRTFRSLINERGEPTAEMQELIAGRIVMDAAQIGYIKQLIEDYTGNPDATVEELVGESARADIKAGKLVKGSKKAAKAFMTKLSKLSEATEVLATVMIYADFKRILTEADFGTEIEIIQEASRLTKRVTPGRSETASGVTALTRSGFGALFAPFLRFKVDTARVMVNSLKLAHEMSNSDNPVLKKHGRIKMASWYSTVGLLTIAMPLIFQRAFGGFGEDEDEAIRASLPDYYRNASLFYFRNSENNGLTIINSTFTNPLSFVGDPISRITNAALFGNASDIPGILGRFVTKDFIGENIVASNALDVMRNKDSSTNYPIYFEADSDGDKVLKSAIHLGKAYAPRLFIQGDRFVDALRREGDEEFWYSPLGVALATVAPFRPMSKTFDDMERAAFNNIRKENSELWRVTSPIFSPAPLAAGEATERYNERITIMEKQARKALELYDGFTKIRGGDETEVKRSAVNAGMSKRRATLLFNRGLMEKQVFPDDDLRRVREIDPARYDEIKAAMRERPSLSPIER